MREFASTDTNTLVAKKPPCSPSYVPFVTSMPSVASVPYVVKKTCW